jgi:DNA polymerase-3 subunit beta
MPFTIHKKNFFEIIQKAYPIIPSKTSLQILLNFKLTFSPDILEITATDLDHSIKLKTAINGDGEFEITVNAKRLFEIVRELHDDELSIDIDENVLIIESGGSFSCKISGADTLDFPKFPEIDNFNQIEMSSNVLKDLIVKSNFAVSKDEARACLCGVLFEVENNTVGMISTDGHRLGSSFCKGEYNLDSKVSSIVSQKSLLHLVRIMDIEDTSSNVKVLFSEKYIVFNTDTFTLCSKLIDGPYPDYKRVIPNNNPKKVTIEKNILLESVRRVSVLSNQKTHLVKFVFSLNELEIVVLNSDIGGEARQIVPIHYEGEEHIIGLNAAYFSEILNIIKTPTIRLEMNTQISACLIFPCYEKEEDKTSEDLFLIMPLRILEEN